MSSANNANLVASVASEQLSRVSDAASQMAGAMATFRVNAAHGRFAAVMGSIADDSMTESGEWSVENNIDADPVVGDALGRINNAHLYDTIRSAMIGHVQDMLAVQRDRIQEELDQIQEGFEGGGSISCFDHMQVEDRYATRLEDAEKDYESARTSLTEQIAEAEKQWAEELRKQDGLCISAHRQEVILRYDKNVLYIEGVAKEMGFIDAARDQLAHEARESKKAYSANPRDYFKSEISKELAKEKRSMEDEKKELELQVQQHFDHSIQGAAMSEAKPERHAFRLVADIQEANAGFKQIQNMDMYSLSRAAETWAIQPNLHRVGHDVDSVRGLHWMPWSIDQPDQIPESLRDVYCDQSKALATKIMNLVTSQGSGKFSGLRSKLLASHKFGRGKESERVVVKANPKDGVMLYYVLIMLIHPLDDEHRRAAEDAIYSHHKKFRHGNPFETLDMLTEKLREAMDLDIRLRWSSCGIPIINTLTARNAEFGVQLNQFRDAPDDPEDSGVALDDMCVTIRKVIRQLDGGGVNWESKTAAAVVEDKTRSEINLLKDQVQRLQSQMGDAKFSHGKGNHETKEAPKPGFCWATGCINKIEKWTKEKDWKLCGTCLMKYRDTRKPVPLVDGTEWGRPKAMRAQLKAMRAEGVDLPKSNEEKEQQTKKRERAKAAKKAKKEGDTPETSKEEEGGITSGAGRQARKATWSESLISELRAEISADDVLTEKGGAARKVRKINK